MPSFYPHDVRLQPQYKEMRDNIRIVTLVVLGILFAAFALFVSAINQSFYPQKNTLFDVSTTASSQQQQPSNRALSITPPSPPSFFSHNYFTLLSLASNLQSTSNSSNSTTPPTKNNSTTNGTTPTDDGLYDSTCLVRFQKNESMQCQYVLQNGNCYSFPLMVRYCLLNYHLATAIIWYILLVRCNCTTLECSCCVVFFANYFV